MRTKPVLKLINSLRFHVNNHDQFKINYDIRNVIKVTQHFQALRTQMTKYPDMDVSKKIANYTNDLQTLLSNYSDYPDFRPNDQKRFVHDLLKCYCFIYFDMQNRCNVKTIHTTVNQAKATAFKKKWQRIEDQLKNTGNAVLDSRFVSDANFTPSPDGTLIIKYVSKRTIHKLLN